MRGKYTTTKEPEKKKKQVFSVGRECERERKHDSNAGKSVATVVAVGQQRGMS